ncbi:MAG: MauE/DoxX family redox-associated membrane protein [Saprospiraceae bacterium]
MSLATMVLMIAAIGLVWTLVVAFGFRAHKNWLVSFLQSFAGALFVFSGAVKAVDPLGTAYKMEQYFAEFESLFQGTWFSFISPIFPRLSASSDTFSVVMIVFEIVLGFMLLIGARPKLTAWLFFLLIVFFLILTGFTYLTGYVPFGVNFFEFGKWGEFQESNMKVTDCGCFGDFVKLKPFTSFMKDVVLLVPALVFLFATKQMHRIFTPLGRSAIVWVSTIGLVIYCLSNYAWNEPHWDFRPFKEGANIAERRALEEEAMGNVKILAYKITNKQTGEVQEIPYDEYMKRFAEFPKEQYDFEQIKSEPEIQPTKISEFDIEDQDGNMVSEELLADPGYTLMIVATKLPYESMTAVTTVMDSIWLVDTVRLEGSDSVSLVRRLDKVTPREMEEAKYAFDEKYVKYYTEKVNPLAEAAEKAGWKVFAVTSYGDPGMIDNFRHTAQTAYPFHLADDILLKTIIRSNPGIVIWKNGVILKKWHFRKLPKAEKVMEKFN